MIRQQFDISKYDWKVEVYYAVDCYYTDEIMGRLYDIGCRGDDLRTAYENLSAGKPDTGLTYSNYGTRQTVMVIGITSSATQFQNSYSGSAGDRSVGRGDLLPFRGDRTADVRKGKVDAV